MSPPDAERGPGGGPRPDQPPTKPADTSTVPRTTWDGHPGLSVGHDRYVRDRRPYSPLALQLLDPEYAADRLLEELGPAACQRLAVALVAKVREVATR